MKKGLRLAAAVLAVLLSTTTATDLHASHYRDNDASATIDAGGVVTLTVRTRWRKGVEPFPFGGVDPARFGQISFPCPEEGMPRTVSPPAGMDIVRVSDGVPIFSFAPASFDLTATTIETDTSDPIFDERTQLLTIPLGSTADPGQIVPPINEPPGGHYDIIWNDYGRLGGLVNVDPNDPCASTANSYGFRVRILWDGTEHATPRFDSDIVPRAVRGLEYNHGLAVNHPEERSFLIRLPEGTGIPTFGPETKVPELQVNPLGELDIPPTVTPTLMDNTIETDGDYVVTVEAEDDVGQIAVRSFLLDAVDSPSNSPPFVEPILDRVAKAGDRIVFTVIATDPDPNQRITLSAPELPPGANFPIIPDEEPPAVSTFSWTPSALEVGERTIQIVVEDDGAPALTDTRTFRIIIEPDNDPPTLVEIANKRVGADPLDIQPFVNETLQFDALAEDPEMDTPNYSAPIFVDPNGDNQPGRVTVVPGVDGMGNPIGTYTFVPTPADIGVWNLTVRADDPNGGGHDEQSVFISVGTFTNQSPAFTIPPAPKVMGQVGFPIILPLEAIDPDPDNVKLRGPHVAGGPGNPASGSFNLGAPMPQDANNPFEVRVVAVDDSFDIDGRVAEVVTFEIDVTPSPLMGTTYYVEKATGSDTPCDLSRENDPMQPFFTLQGAFDCLRSNHAGNITGLGDFRIRILDSSIYDETVELTGLITSAGDTLTLDHDPNDVDPTPQVGFLPTITGSGVRGTGIDIHSINFVTISGIGFTNFEGTYGNAIQIDGASDIAIRDCEINPQSDFGILIGWRHVDPLGLPGNNITIENNVIIGVIEEGSDPDNRGQAIHIMSGPTGTTIRNNTFYGYDKAAIFFMDEPSGSEAKQTSVHNNIFYPTVAGSIALDISDLDAQTEVVCNHNAFYLSGNPASSFIGRWNSAPVPDLFAWQAATGQDAGSLDVAPLFASPGSDFHLQSTAGRWNGNAFVPDPVHSPCIDAGDPADPATAELPPNGGRINMGAYGGTDEASLSSGPSSCDQDGDGWCGGDCDDGDPLACPNGTQCPETCDGLDNDCDGFTDEEPSLCDDGDYCTGTESCTGTCSTSSLPELGLVPEDSLQVQLLPGDDLGLSWLASCNACDNDYAIYEGELGNYYSHTSRLCSTGGALSAVITPTPHPGGSYVLVVPLITGVVESSYGLKSDLSQRPQGTAACAPLHQPGSCMGAPGDTCSTGPECLSGFCVDGFCCNTSCSDGCSACNLPGTEGICAPVAPGSGPPEVCDGLDNNCDGVTDEGFSVGSSCTGTGACSLSGVTECDGGGSVRCSVDPGGSADASAPETCDTVDNDCDGTTDEGFLVGSGCDGIGLCGPGLRECDGSGGVRCSTEPGGSGDESVPELCDGLDNDCDGGTDESFGVGETCIGVGRCGEGILECSGPSMSVCSTDPGGSADESETEVCDALDDDCDGSIDEGCACQEGAMRPCGASEGVCIAGTQTCTGGVWTACAPPQEPDVEMCDGADNDCDGNTDEGFGVGQTCSGGLYGCPGGSTECRPGGGSGCSRLPGGSEDQSSMEMCNGIDDDCDDLVDEGCFCTPSSVQGCGLSAGTCSQGTQTCDPSGEWGACTGATVPQAETCDGLDNDCDGTTDEFQTFCGLGECRTVGTCSGGSDSCTPLPPSPELCDGLDNDCDGVADNPFSIGGACDGIGECGAGRFECGGPVSSMCSTDPGGSSDQSQPEVCDGLDNDCDGATDEEAGCLSLGDTCPGDSDCASGFCRDGVCCDTGCSGQCESCDQGGGICSPHAPDTDPESECGPFTCDGAGMCRTSCTDSSQCSAGNVCDGGLCVPGFTLTVTKTGNGLGDVQSAPVGIECGTDCNHGYATGTPVLLIAVDGPSSVHSGWSGDPDCADGQVTMTQNLTCTASFTYIEQPPLRTLVEPCDCDGRPHDAYAATASQGNMKEFTVTKPAAAGPMPSTREHILLGRQVGLPAVQLEGHSGEIRLGAVDLRIKGRGMDFVWARRYRSRLRLHSTIGHQWDFSYNIFAEQSGPDLVLHDGNGRNDLFTMQNGGTWERAEHFHVIEQQPDTSYHVVFPDTSRYELFPLNGSPSEGRLSAIVDRNGNTMSFTYDGLGRLMTVTETLGRNINIAYDPAGNIASITDFAGRQVLYDYYDGIEPGGSLGDLKSVTTPAVTGTPNGNDFPVGKTAFYTYAAGFGDEKLNHNLLTLTDPKGQVRLTVTTSTTTDPADPAFDRVTRMVLGDPGDIIDLSYIPQTPGPGNNFATTRVIVNDRVGNVSELFYDSLNRLVIEQDFTGRANPDNPTTDTVNRPTAPLRVTDPVFFETRYTFNSESLPQTAELPNGNTVIYSFEFDLSPASPRFSYGNLRQRTVMPGLLGGDQTQILETWQYTDGLTHPSGTHCFVAQHVDGRGNTTSHAYDGAGNKTQTTHRIPSIVEDFEYNGFGQLTAYVHPDNGSAHRRRDEFSYYPTGPQTGYLNNQVIDADPNGFLLTTTYEYDIVGNITRTIDPRGNDSLQDVNQLDQIVRTSSRETAPGSGVRYERDFFYDDNDNITRVDIRNIDDLGVTQPNPELTTTYEYDILNYMTRIIQEIDPNDDVVTELEYDDNRNLTLTRLGEATSGGDPFNLVRTLYDERDLVFESIRGDGGPDQSTTRYDYDENGNLTRSTHGTEDPVSPRVANYIYDGYDRAVSATDPLGNVDLYTYDANHNRLTVHVDGEVNDGPGSGSNVRLHQTEYAYDSMDRITQTNVDFFDTSTQGAIGDGLATTTLVYSDTSQILSVTDDNSHTTTYQYDTANRLLTATDPKTNVVSYAYDLNSNPIAISELDKSDLLLPDAPFTTTYAYDNLDRMTRIVDNVGNQTDYGYDSRDNTLRVTDPRGNEQTHEYDGLNRLTSTDRVLTDTGNGGGTVTGSIVTTRLWDDTSRLAGSTDGIGNLTTYAYDSLNRLTLKGNSDATSSTYDYDVHGNLTSSTDGNANSVTYEYDLMNRMTLVNVTPGAEVVGTTTENYQYDGLSRMVQADDDDSQVTRIYDSLDRVIQEAQQDLLPGGTSGTVSTEYDAVGNLTRVVYPGGRALDLAYDASDRLDTIIDSPPGPTPVLEVDMLGRHTVEQMTYGNGTRYTLTYDGIRRLVGTNHVRLSDGFQIENRGYIWDPSSNKMQADDLLAMPIPATTTYEYDSINRMTRSTIVSPAPQPPQDYVLDGANNRNQVVNGSDPGPYVLDSNFPVPADLQMNQYTQTPFDDRQYDENGNLLQTSNPAFGPLQQYQFDYLDRLASATDLMSAATTSYRYDALGRRITKVDGPTTTRFFYLGPEVIEEQDDLGATEATYVRLGAIYSSTPSSIGKPPAAAQMVRDGQEFYLHGDDIGSTRKLTDASGVIVEQYEYEDYGRPLTVSSVGNPYLFRGLRFDIETGFGLREFLPKYIDHRAGRDISSYSVSTDAGFPFRNQAGNAYDSFASNPRSILGDLSRPGGGQFSGQHRETDFNFVSRMGTSGFVPRTSVAPGTETLGKFIDGARSWARGKGGADVAMEEMTLSFRPTRVTPRPLVGGVQTAIVVGRSGEEIYPDEYGRVKVQFNTAQAMEEKTAGGIIIPDTFFVEGDPDRPLVTGRVYTGSQSTSGHGVKPSGELLVLREDEILGVLDYSAPVIDYARPRKISGYRTVGDITLKRGVVGDSYFFDWVNEIRKCAFPLCGGYSAK